VADVDERGSGGRHPTGGKQRAWTDKVRRPAAGASEGIRDSTVHGLRRAAKPQSSVAGRSGRHASRRPKSSAILAPDIWSCWWTHNCQWNTLATSDVIWSFHVYT